MVKLLKSSRSKAFGKELIYKLVDQLINKFSSRLAPCQEKRFLGNTVGVFKLDRFSKVLSLLNKRDKRGAMDNRAERD